MFTITGQVIKTRSFNFDKIGPTDFVELLVSYEDRASQAYEVKLAKGMAPEQFPRGATITLAVVPAAGDKKRLYISALTKQPAGLPKIDNA